MVPEPIRKLGQGMWMSECIIVVDRNNPDSNNLADIVAAIGDVGQVLQCNDHEYVIEAAVPAHEVPVVKAMAGVSYVRCVFNYFCGQAPRKSA